MRGDRHTFGPSRDRRVDLLDVAQVLVIGVIAAFRDHLTLRRVVEIGEGRVVELEVRATELAETADLFCVGRAEVTPKLIDVVVHVGVDGRGAASIVDHARRGDRELGNRRRRHRLQELERVGEDCVFESHRSVDLQCGRGE